MSNNFCLQKIEVKKLNYKYKHYLMREYIDGDWSYYLSNPDNFIEGIFYHQANSLKDKQSVLKSGFNDTKIDKSNCGAGRGLYLGRDKNAIINFYSPDFNNPQNFTIKITGNFNFLDLVEEKSFQKFFLKNKNNIENSVCALEYDGIRYYDPEATGEEFILFNIKKAKLWNT
ncbi:MAG: hypothetical protein V1833_01345 [Elusimicrobiota bacterium]